MSVKDYSNEVKFQVGQRVKVELKEVPKEERNSDGGIIVAIYTRFPGTPKMRKIMYHVRFENGYIKRDKILFSQIWEIRVLTNKLTIL